jgi:hypothetical protein
MSSVYQINKGINRAIEFKGLKAQYIWWLAGGLVVILILFAIIFMLGINTYICLVFALGSGSTLFFFVYRFSNLYGEHGMMKMMARRSLPAKIVSRSRKIFIKS